MRFSQTSHHAHQMWCRTGQAPHWMLGCRSTWYLVVFRCLHPHRNRQRCCLCPFKIRWKDRRSHKFHYIMTTLKMIRRTRNYSPTGSKCITLEENVRIMHRQLYSVEPPLTTTSLKRPSLYVSLRAEGYFCSPGGQSIHSL